MKNARLFTPGPTAVPPEVLETQARPLIHHRTPEFRRAHTEVLGALKKIMKTDNPVVVVSSSGTGAMEASVVNLTKPGDNVLVTECGKFGERWTELARAYGLEPIVVGTEWGTPVTPQRVESAFADNPGITALFTTHSETSTGVLQDVAAFAKIAHNNDALVVVDGITSICAHDVRTDEWELDVVIGGSQKGVMMPPGLAFLSVSERAQKRFESRGHGVYYFDLAAAIKKAESGDTPYTPAISLFFALGRALEMIIEEGIDQVVARHAANARAVRAAVTAIGLDLFATVPSNAITAVKPPEGTAANIVERMEHNYDVKIAGGQAGLKGKIFRLGHLGYYYPTDMYTLISALEATLADLEIVDTFGQGLAALRASYSEEILGA